MLTSGHPAQPRTTPVERTFAIGDLHGEVSLLRRLLAILQPRPTDTLLFLGDYVDRGEDSVATVEEIAALRAVTQVVALRGNHDAAWLEMWTGHGYRERPAIPGARALWDQYHGAPPVAIGQFLETTTVAYEGQRPHA